MFPCCWRELSQIPKTAMSDLRLQMCGGGGSPCLWNLKCLTFCPYFASECLGRALPIKKLGRNSQRPVKILVSTWWFRSPLKNVIPQCEGPLCLHILHPIWSQSAIFTLPPKALKWHWAGTWTCPWLWGTRTLGRTLLKIPAYLSCLSECKNIFCSLPFKRGTLWNSFYHFWTSTFSL